MTLGQIIANIHVGDNMNDMFYEYDTDRFSPLTYKYCAGIKNKPHYHNQIEMFYVVSGTQVVTINGQTFEAKKGDIVFCNSYDIHQYYFKATSLILFIGIPTSYTAFFNSHTASGRLAENHIPKSKATAEIYKVMKTFSTAKQHSFMHNFGLVNQLLGLLFETVGAESQNNIKSQNLIQTILNYINKNYCHPLTLNTIADHCNYNPYYISRIFNKTFNCNLNSYINLRRLEALTEIKTQNPEKSITEIAAEVGFPTQRTFYRVFKEVYGCTPRQYFTHNQENTFEKKHKQNSSKKSKNTGHS